MAETNKGDDLEFQVIDWNSYHEIDTFNEEKYVIQLFGRTEDDKDVCIKVTDFKPYFYVEIPSNWTDKHVDRFIDELRKKLSFIMSNNPLYDDDKSSGLIYYRRIKKHRFYGFTNKKFFDVLLLRFKSHTSMKEYSKLLSRPIKIKNFLNNATYFQRYEANIEPHIRFMHINKLSACGWISIEKKFLTKNKQYSNCYHSYETKWTNVKPAENDNRMAPLIIMGYDIECISCDINFPLAKRKTDKIIQIGMTLYRYGSMQCYEKHILTLKECSSIEGVNVQCYKTEKGLLKGWAEKIRDIRPDIICGYNTFGFDDKYIYERIKRIDDEEAAKQNIPVEYLENKLSTQIFNILGKVNNDYIIDFENVKKSLTSYDEVKLKSSALGDNELNFFKIPGIISIDMMKVIQRDHRLSGYKLDNVSANFIRENAEKVIEISDIKNKNSTLINIYTKSTKALDKGAYIQIMINDGYSSSPLTDGAKYSVLDIETVTEKVMDEKTKKELVYVYQCIKIEIPNTDIEKLRECLLNKLLKIYWTFAKDDMHHTLINKYFKEGNADKIAQIAKYCLKDCMLVNLLLAKLETIVSSIGMAKVCHVPLSYLFLRGQGVKIFSLVSKCCREYNFVVPVLQKKNVDLTGDDEGYEGATVINPTPGVYLSPIGVLDYSSLYPNSMRERNLSPECYINDYNYNNVDGYVYHDIFITLKDKKGKILRNIDGTPKKEHHRFAQEIVTEEKMKLDMGEFYSSLEKTLKDNCEKIKNKKYLTSEDVKSLIKHYHDKMDSDIEKTKNDNTLSDKNKQQLAKLAAETESNYNIKHLQSIENKIKDIVNDHDERLKQISSSKISPEKKQKKIAKIETELKSEIELVEKSEKISKNEIKMLLEIEEESFNKKLNFEKSRRYNIVNGKWVFYGILPRILTELLNKRKATVAQCENEKDPFKKAILNSLQLAYKVTANSLYGQTGAPTSPIYFLPIAASTTAIGRERLHFARTLVENTDDPELKNVNVIYGDTDSIFINLNLVDKNGESRTDKSALIDTIRLCKKLAALINSKLPKPQCIVYEKTFYPFILVAKKKYVGIKYTDDDKKSELSSMGIVLKRRDNAPIVKIVVGGIINNICENCNIARAVKDTKTTLNKIMNGEYSIDKFIISKALKAKYKKPKTIAHKVLADRMAIRDPGNKPQINDRIPYVYVVKNFDKAKKKKVLQGEYIEHPDYVINNNLQIDYLHYLKNQIMEPSIQFLDLIMNHKEIDKLFNKYIISEESKRIGRQSIEKWTDSDKLSEYKNSSKSNKSTINKYQKKVNDVKYESQEILKWIDKEKLQSKKPPQNTVGAKIVKKSRIKPPVQLEDMTKWMPVNNQDSDIDLDWSPDI